MVLTLGNMAMAQDEEEKPDKIISTTIDGDMIMGYLHYPGYSVENASMDADFDEVHSSLSSGGLTSGYLRI